MSLNVRGRGVPGRAVAIGASALVMSAVTMGAASAQNSGCTDVQKMLLQRKSISDSITAATKGKKQIDAGVACRNFGQLVSNGQTLIKWVDTNKDWCQIPDGFVEGIKADHGRAIAIRGQACSVAAKQVQMEKQAKAAGGGGGGLLGGNGLSGQSRLPQGAL